MRRDEQPVVRRQPRDRLLEPILQLENAELPIRRGPLVRRLVRIERNRRGFAVLLHAHVRDDAVHPRGEARFATKIRQPAMDPQEHFLREILGAGPILHRAGDQGVHEIFVTIDQLLKRTLVAGTAALDELALVDSLHPPRY